jgi:hypothetical protein
MVSNDIDTTATECYSVLLMVLCHKLPDLISKAAWASLSLGISVLNGSTLRQRSAQPKGDAHNAYGCMRPLSVSKDCSFKPVSGDSEEALINTAARVIECSLQRNRAFGASELERP